MSAKVSLLLMLVSMTPAAEIVRRDVQFSLDSAPTSFDYTIDSPGGSFAGSDAFNFGVQSRLGGRWAITSPGWSLAPVIGSDLMYTDRSGAGGGLTSYGLGVTGGVAWAINEHWSADAEVGLSYERADLTLDGGAGLSGSGTLIDTDVRVRALRQLDRTWSLGVELGWQRASGSFTADQQRDLTMDITGWTAGLIICWRMSMRPADLE